MAFQYYLSFKGKTQGQVKGSSTKGSSHDKWIEINAFKMGAVSPRDAASGLSTGKRTHKPVVITKENDPSSPLLFNARWSGEVLTEVILEARVKGHVFKRITLTNAILADTSRSLRPSSSESHSTSYLEEFSFVFDKIVVENVTGSTSTSDDWTTPNN